MMPRWFLLLNGVALLCMGGVMLVGRLRQEGPAYSPRKWLGVTWSLLCCGVGVVLLLMAYGQLGQPGAAPAPKERQGPVFPVDR